MSQVFDLGQRGVRVALGEEASSSVSLLDPVLRDLRLERREQLLRLEVDDSRQKLVHDEVRLGVGAREA